MSADPGTVTGYLEGEGARLYYEATGDGYPLLLIHAGIANLRMWDEHIPVFAARYRVIRYDTRGFGKTRTEDVPFSNREDIRRLLEHLGVERAHIVGVSRAGSIAIDFTLENPQMVSALIVVATGVSGRDEAPDPVAEAAFEEMQRLEEAGDMARFVEREVELWVDGPGQPVGRAHARIRDLVRQWELEAAAIDTQGQPQPLGPPAAGRLDEIGVPTLAIVGDLDVRGVLDATDLVVNRVPGAGKAVVTGTAHMLTMERPDEFETIVLDFLASVPV